MPPVTAPRLIKRIVIVGAVLQGVKIAQPARDLGVSRSWASREAHHPETQRFIARLEKQDPETAAASLRRTLTVIADEMIPDTGGFRAGKRIVGEYDKVAGQDPCEHGGFCKHTPEVLPFSTPTPRNAPNPPFPRLSLRTRRPQSAGAPWFSVHAFVLTPKPACGTIVAACMARIASHTGFDKFHLF